LAMKTKHVHSSSSFNSKQGSRRKQLRKAGRLIVQQSYPQNKFNR